MTSKTDKNLKIYQEKLRLLHALNAAQSLLSWDRETHMPKGASQDRGETMAALAGFAHHLFTDKAFVNVVEELHEHSEELEKPWQRSVYLTQRELRKSVKLPKAFVEETNVVMNAAHAAWLEAKLTNNFELYAPHLSKVIENRKKYAELLDPSKDPYDLNLDDYEEGLTTETVNKVFTPLKAGLRELVKQVAPRQLKVANPFNGVALDKQQLLLFLSEMIETIGFDMKRGAIGEVEHPFEINITPNDVRLNTKFDKNDHSFAIMGMIHELGHGLYEQNASAKYRSYYLDGGVSLGIHESQSRFLENMIGRSDAFWSYFLPVLHKYFPQLKQVKVSDVVAALNHVEPSLIRTEADEVTYNLHIILRFELEQKIMHGKVKVTELPELWRATMKDLLGIEPMTDKEGVLQDVHWSWGNFGYFPTYTIGNLNAAQLLHSFEKTHPGWKKEVGQGNFKSYFNWFNEHIWQHGSFHTPSELMTKATDEELNPQYFLDYLKKKYLKA